MNKKLIAVAVAGACVAPAAMAQTANPVTLYGRVYVTFESVEAKGNVGNVPEVVRRNRVSDQSSLLGVRGTEDLGGGLKAFFQLETAFKPDQNDTTFAARNSGVGLQGGFGSVLLGRWDTPFKTSTIAVDPYGDLTIGGITAAMNGSGIANGQKVEVRDPSELIADFERGRLLAFDSKRIDTVNHFHFAGLAEFTHDPQGIIKISLDRDGGGAIHESLRQFA